ncbi:MAG: T9SS type A sorting domain-containing protein [Bacteroidetes bacterium]|nr:T9SS type A sorting domain-containing protein [Bacteroidota bacterium]
MKIISRILVILCLPILVFAQLKNDGGSLKITAGSSLKVTGDFVNVAGSNLTNEGTLTSTGNITNEATATLQGDGQYTLSGDWTNAGTFAAGSSTVTFDGGTNSSVTSGGDVFYKLEMDKTAANLLLADGLMVDELLEFLSNENRIILTDNHLTLSPAADILGYDETNYIVTDGTGELHKSALGATPFTFPVGFDEMTYNPVILTQNGTADELGVRCLEHHFENGAGGAQFAAEAVDASWEITETVPGGSDLTVTVQWVASDELSFNRNNSAIGFWNGSKWDYGTVPGSAALGSDPFIQNRMSIGGVGVIGVRSGAAFPVELIDFQAVALNTTDALLTWKTASEINASHFEIERSVDGVDWFFVGKTTAAGQSSAEQNYSLVDEKVYDGSPISLFYYRLKMVDFDGSFEYSPMRSVQFGNEGKGAIGQAFPNPANLWNASVRVPIFTQEAADVEVAVYDGLGRLVAAIRKEAVLGQQELEIHLTGMAAGPYLLKTRCGNLTKTERIILQ